jgi:hypothetical protein
MLEQFLVRIILNYKVPVLYKVKAAFALCVVNTLIKK